MNTEQTKKCRECQTDIPKNARRCPNCRAKQGIGAGGLLVAIIFIGITASVVMSAVNDSSSTTSTYAPSAISNFELGIYKVESDEFQYMEQSEVNLWQSYSNREKVGAIAEGDVVEVTSHDSVNDYCQVTLENQSGWIACGWLVKQ